MLPKNLKNSKQGAELESGFMLEVKEKEVSWFVERRMRAFIKSVII